MFYMHLRHFEFCPVSFPVLILWSNFYKDQSNEVHVRIPNIFILLRSFTSNFVDFGRVSFRFAWFHGAWAVQSMGLQDGIVHSYVDQTIACAGGKECSLKSFK